MLNLGRGRFNFLSSWTNTKQEKVSPQTRLCLETQFIPQEKADWVTSPTHGTGDTTVCTCQSHHRRGSAPGRTAFEGATEPKHRDAPRGPQQQQEGAWETCAGLRGQTLRDLFHFRNRVTSRAQRRPPLGSCHPRWVGWRSMTPPYPDAGA